MIKPQKRKNRNKGFFITFEGIEGCGKSTHIKKLALYLKSLGFKVVQTREPGGTDIGQKIRSIFLDPAHKNIHVLTELFLVLADRCQHVQELILPYLSKNFIVLSDRYMDSTFAYQSSKKIDLKLIEKLNKIAINNIIPDLTFLLDQDTKRCLKNVKKLSKEYQGGDRIEKKDLNYHKKVRAVFDHLQKEYPQRIKKITLFPSPDRTQEEIRKVARNFLKKRKLL